MNTQNPTSGYTFEELLVREKTYDDHEFFREEGSQQPIELIPFQKLTSLDERNFRELCADIGRGEPRSLVVYAKDGLIRLRIGRALATAAANAQRSVGWFDIDPNDQNSYGIRSIWDSTTLEELTTLQRLFRPSRRLVNADCLVVDNVPGPEVRWWNRPERLPCQDVRLFNDILVARVMKGLSTIVLTANQSWRPENAEDWTTLTVKESIWVPRTLVELDELRKGV
jgi:hypothetical protein